jgi:CheY-like chemotaxis protein
MRVLILENYLYRAGDLMKQLAKLGITDVTHVTTADKCIRELEQKKFDLIFMDYHLDNMEFDITAATNNGGKVAAWLKDNPSNPNNAAKIIVHSGSESGAAEICKYLTSARWIKNAWKKEVFPQVAEQLDLGTVAAGKNKS